MKLFARFSDYEINKIFQILLWVFGFLGMIIFVFTQTKRLQPAGLFIFFGVFIFFLPHYLNAFLCLTEGRVVLFSSWFSLRGVKKTKGYKVLAVADAVLCLIVNAILTLIMLYKDKL